MNISPKFAAFAAAPFARSWWLLSMQQKREGA
jgi:hypothetical protein